MPDLFNDQYLTILACLEEKNYFIKKLYEMFLVQQIRMISERSSETEDADSNDAENSALHLRNKLYF